MLRMYVRHLLFFEFPDPGRLEDAIDALQAGFAATIRQLPFLAGTIRPSPEADGLTLQYPESPSDELINQIFTFSYSQAGNPDLEYTKMEKDGFPPLPIWGQVFCPSLLRNHPGLDDEIAAGLISFDKGQPVPVFAAQATFVRGGLVLGVYSQHNAVDGTGMTKIYKILSENVRSRGGLLRASRFQGNGSIDLDSQRRLLDALAEGHETDDFPDVRFPGTPSNVPPFRDEPYKVSSKIFVFPAANISELAASLSSHTGRQISSFVALISLIWTNVTLARASALAEKKIQTTKLDMAFDHRRNLDQHFKDTYLGNCVTGVTASAPVSAMLFKTTDDSVYDEQLAPIASTISHTLSSISPSWFKARLNLFSRTPKPWLLRSDCDVRNGPDLFVTSWMHIGTDCTWGIPGTTGEGPAAIRKPQSHIEGLVHVLPKVRIENGFPALEVLVCLEEWEMERVVRRLEGERWAVRVISA